MVNQTAIQKFEQLKRDAASAFQREPTAVKLIHVMLDRAFIHGKLAELERVEREIKKANR